MYTAAIIGLGNIAIGYDIPDWKGPYVLTHAKAYIRHKGYNLRFGVDISECNRVSFTKTTGLPSYASMKIFSEHPIDIVSVCVPTKFHYKVISELLLYTKPKLIICEKPIADNISQYNSIKRKCSKAGVILVVNYIRKWDPAVRYLKKMFDINAYGHITSIHCYYSKGLLNNASHFVDLLHFWFGRETSVKVIDSSPCRINGDIDSSFVMSYDKFNAVFQCGNEKDYSLFEIDIIAEKARISYLNGGGKVFVTRSEKDRIYKNYNKLSEKSTEIKNNMSKYQLNVMSGIYNSMKMLKNLVSNEITAGETLQTCMEVKQKCKSLQ